MQTVLNRLAERGLLSRIAGQAARGPTGRIIYRVRLREEEYLAQSIERALAGASREARRSVMAQLIGQLDDDALRALRRNPEDERP